MSIGTDFPEPTESIDNIELPTEHDESVLETVRLSSKAYQHEVDARENAKLTAIEQIDQEYAAVIATATSVYFEALAAAHREGFDRDGIAAYIKRRTDAEEGDIPS